MLFSKRNWRVRSRFLLLKSTCGRMSEASPVPLFWSADGVMLHLPAPTRHALLASRKYALNDLHHRQSFGNFRPVEAKFGYRRIDFTGYLAPLNRSNRRSVS